MATTTRTSKTITISLPPEMAAHAEALARSDNRTMSELFREAFRLYYSRHVDEIFERTRKYAATRNPEGHTEEDVPRLIHEVRAEEDARRPAKAS